MRYPLLEAGTAASFAGVALVYPSVYVIAMFCAFCQSTLAVGAIDLEHKIIPNRITYPAFPVFAVAIVVGWAIGQGLDPVRAVIGALVYGGVFLLIAVIAPRGLGMGDVKLTGLIGLVMGSLGLRYVGVAAGAAILSRGSRRGHRPPCGERTQERHPVRAVPPAGALVAVFWGEQGGTLVPPFRHVSVLLWFLILWPCPGRLAMFPFVEFEVAYYVKATTEETGEGGDSGDRWRPDPQEDPALFIRELMRPSHASADLHSVHSLRDWRVLRRVAPITDLGPWAKRRVRSIFGTHRGCQFPRIGQDSLTVGHREGANR